MSSRSTKSLISIARVFLGSISSSSSRVMKTYWSGVISYPLTIFSYGTSLPSSSATRLCLIREPSPSRSSRKLTVCLETALYSFTGTFRSPKLIDPLQIALAMNQYTHLPVASPTCTRSAVVLRLRLWLRAIITNTSGYRRFPAGKPPPERDLACTRGFIIVRPLDRPATRNSSALLLPHHLPGILVLSQPLVHRLAQRSLVRPLGELDLAHELGLAEPRPAALRGADVEGAVGAGARSEHPSEAIDLLVREPASHAAGVDQERRSLQVARLLGRRVVVADQQRAYVAAAHALARHPATDHELLLAPVPHLDPVAAAPARTVGAVQPLGDHALEPAGACRLEQRLPLSHVVPRRLPARAVELQPGEQPAPFLVGQLEGRSAVEMQEVEGDVGHGGLRGTPLDREVVGQAHAELKALEPRPLVLVEGDDLSVDDGAMPVEGIPEPCQLRVASGDVVAAAALDAQPALAVRVGQRAYAVPLDLETPPTPVRRASGLLGEHRAHDGARAHTSIMGRPIPGLARLGRSVR